MRILLDQYPAQDAPAEARNLARLGLPEPDGFGRANGVLNPLGQGPARGWLLLLRRHLLALDLDALHAVTLDDGLGRVLVLYNLVVAREPACVTPGATADPDAVYLVELADSRWRVHNPYYSVPANKQYNVRAPGWGGAYYDDSRNAGSDWTWSTLAGDLWGLMSTQLGTFPGLPVTPDGTPEGWAFPGVPAWPALCRVLHRIGCAVACDLTRPTSQYSVVQVGATDAAATAALALASGRKILDREYLPQVRGRVPYGVRVYFHRQNEHYGTEETTQKTSSQWQTASVYSVDVAGPDAADAEPGVYHPVWDDLPALYDYAGSVTNAAACSTRATERANDFYRMLRATGGGRLHQAYSGLLRLSASSVLRGVAWRQDPLGLGGGDPGGMITEVVRHPFRTLEADDVGGWRETPDSASDRPPDFRPTAPVYPHLLQVIELAGSSPDGSGRYDATVERFKPSDLSFADRESVYALDLAGASSLTSGDKYLGRLVGYSNSRPVYAFRSPPSVTPAAFSGAWLQNISNQSVGSASGTNLTWDTDVYDTDSYHDPMSHADRITVPANGYYLFSATVYWDPNATANRRLRILDSSGNPVVSSEILAPGAGFGEGCSQNVSCVRQAAANAWFVVEVYQDSGSTLDALCGQTIHPSEFSCTKLGSA